MRTFARIFNAMSGVVATVLNWIMAINEQKVVAGVVLNAILLLTVLIFELTLSELSDKDFKDWSKVILGSWIAVLLLFIFVCCTSFKDVETYDKAIDAYNNGRYEEALDGFMKVKDMYDTDDYLETVVRLKGTDVEVIE